MPDTLFCSLFGQEKTKLVQKLISLGVDEKEGNKDLDLSGEVPQTLLDLYMTILNDESLPMASRAMMVTETAGLPSNPELAHQYWAIKKATSVRHFCLLNWRYVSLIVASRKSTGHQKGRFPEKQSCHSQDARCSHPRTGSASFMTRPKYCFCPL